MRVAPGIWIATSLVGVVLAPAAGTEAAVLDASWTAPVTNADGTRLTDLAGYRVYVGTSTPTCPSSSFHSVSSPTSTPSANQTVRTTITGLAPGTTYSMRVTAVDGSGQQSGCTAAVSGVARAALSVSPSGTVSFGSAVTGGSIDRTFTVQNMTGSTLTGGSSVAAPFSIVSGGSFSLATGASQAVVVRFRPTLAGTFAANVNFTAQGDTISRGVSGSATGSLSTTPPPSTPTLSVSRSGSGSGTVTSSPSGISCGSDCTQTYTAGTRVTLTASAASGSTFAGWSGGGCSGTGTCSVTINAALSVTATFNRPSTTPTLSVSRSGSGTVTSSPSGISCGSDCTQTYTAGTRVTLTASAASGSRFAGWSGGGCSGTGTCTVTLNSSIGVTATFNSATSILLPDLIATSLSIPSTVFRTSGFPISFNVVNQGSVAAGTTRLNIYLTQDRALSSGNVLLRVLTISAVPAGGTISNAITQTLPSGTGTGSYYIFLVVDQRREVAESNESNNTLGVRQAITVR
jgi:hypothetical protein